MRLVYGLQPHDLLMMTLHDTPLSSAVRDAAEAVSAICCNVRT